MTDYLKWGALNCAPHNNIKEIKCTIDRLLKEKKYAIIAVDGDCCGGKTTLAAELAGHWEGSVVHMDDFFLTKELRTPERLSTPGGNIHHERFLEDVIPHLRQGREFSYRIFDCSRMDYTKKRRIAPAKLTIVEGAYSMHPIFGKYYDLSVFISARTEIQLRRIKTRNGEAALCSFAEKWIPMEILYQKTFGIREKADIIINNDSHY